MQTYSSPAVTCLDSCFPASSNVFSYLLMSDSTRLHKTVFQLTKNLRFITDKCALTDIKPQGRYNKRY